MQGLSTSVQAQMSVDAAHAVVPPLPSLPNLHQTISFRFRFIPSYTTTYLPKDPICLRHLF
jgi:hypothetical protein